MDQLGYVKASDDSPIYVAYHAPAQTAAGTPVLILPPLFEERKSSYAALRKLAVKLAAAGHATMRFDYRGSGESGGSSAARRWATMAEDASSAREALARLSGQPDAILLGLRLGATLALQEAARGNAKAVVALAPIIVGSTQVRQWKMRSKIRSELTTDPTPPYPPLEQRGGEQQPAQHGQDAHATLDFDGYEVHPGFFEDVATIDLRQSGALVCPALVVQISHRSEAAAESTQLVAALGAKAKLECLRLEPFWDKLDDVDTGPLDDIVVRTVSG
jgi:pimeloyl-ACP methyl ester carboxylesterase